MAATAGAVKPRAPGNVSMETIHSIAAPLSSC
jgi:hypothetical protein